MASSWIPLRWTRFPSAPWCSRAPSRRTSHAWAPPLASGLLTGKYVQGQEPPAGTRLAAWGPRAGRMLSDKNFDLVDKLSTFAQTRGHSILDLAMGWLASKRYVPSVIAGATSPEQITQNVAALEWRLNGEEMAEVDRITA